MNPPIGSLKLLIAIILLAVAWTFDPVAWRVRWRFSNVSVTDCQDYGWLLPGFLHSHWTSATDLYDGTYLRHDGPEHVLAVAPTRSGKGVGLVVPTLLTWAQSAVIHDIKGENWELTAGWRSGFSDCVLFDPTDMQSACFNPLLEVRKGPSEVRDVHNIADILVDPDGTRQRDHWDKTSHALLIPSSVMIDSCCRPAIPCDVKV